MFAEIRKAYNRTEAPLVLTTHADKFHDRSALTRQGGDLKLMEFTTIFFTADLTSKPNSAIS